MKLKLPWVLLLINLFSIRCGDCKLTDTSMTLDCNTEFNNFEDYKYVGVCPSCSAKYCNIESLVRGYKKYSPSSGICCSGIQMGVIGTNGGQMEVHKILHSYRGWINDGATQNNITSQKFNLMKSHYILQNVAVLYTSTLHDENPKTAPKTTKSSTTSTTTNTMMTSYYLVNATTSSAVEPSTKISTIGKNLQTTKTTPEHSTGVKKTVEDDHTDGNSSPPSLTSTQQVVTVTELTSSRRNEIIAHDDVSSDTVAIWIGCAIGAAAIIVLVAILFGVRHAYKRCFILYLPN